jgi:twitching motility protein PilT
VNKERFNQLLAAMIGDGAGVSDLLFLPGRPAQLDHSGRLRPYVGDLIQPLVTPELTRQLADILIEGNQLLVDNLRQSGSCDCSYALPGQARFRANIYQQSGQLALVLRKLSNTVPQLDKLGLPPVVGEIVKEHAGIVFVTGATGAGKTTTLAAILNELNRTQDIHVVTLEDPIEYVHPPARASFSQRELGKDFFSFPVGLRAALRQAPKAILVGEIRDRETMEVALTAAETGHIVFSTLHTINATQTINRILGMFHRDEEQLTRQRLADTLRWVVSQQLVRKIDGGLHLVTEVMGSNMRTREAIIMGESDKRNLHDIIEGSVTPWGWHSFEQSLLKAFQARLISEETAVIHSTHKSSIRQALDKSKHTHSASPRYATDTADCFISA